MRAKHSMRRAWIWGGALAVFLIAPRLWPQAPLSSQIASSRSVTAVNGELLRLTLASDEQYRLWTPLAEIAPALPEATLLYEDRWFYWHPGVNPWALARAALASWLGQRRFGGSTITMQLARRLYRIDSRSVAGKLHQIVAALWLEWRYSKRKLLEAYLNLAPFGGNVEGVGAASLVYFGKPARALSVPEALNLAVIPQNPRKRLAEAAELRAARTRLAQHWARRHPRELHLTNEVALQVPFKTRAQLPFRAPHAVDALLRQSSQREIHASLNLAAQSTLERVMNEYLQSRRALGLSNASALLVEASTMQVKALVGSANYHDPTLAGQVNGVLAKRSPGSTLKPFIYALALDQGLIHSGTILKDAPTSYGGFSPENFDGDFVGPVSAQEALIRSRNVPAVSLAARLGPPNLYDFLKLAGVQKLAPAAHYGLALALGGSEVTPEELAQLYALLANRGEWRALRYLADDKTPTQSLLLLSPAAAFITLDMLRQTPRPDTFAPARPAVAWKTGTSWGFRDAWTAGVFGPYVLVVWIGNFDGSANPAFIGIQAAAPLFMRMVDALRAECLAAGEVAAPVPPDVQQLEICSASGDLPNEACRIRSSAWFITGKSPIRISTLHRKVLIDSRSGQVVCAPNSHTQEQIFEYWPSDMRALFKRAGLPLRTPPLNPCATEDFLSDQAPQIVSPLRGVTHIQRLKNWTPLALRADSSSREALHWFANNTLLGSALPGESLTWLPPQAGSYVLRVVDAQGRVASREISVELAP